MTSISCLHSAEQAQSAGPATQEQSTYVARQPILDLRSNVFGYELLFRSGPASLAFDGDGDAATRSVLDSSLVVGLERLTGGLPMFINCTQEALIRGLVHVLPPNHTVLELLETLSPDPSLIRVCQNLKAKGYRLALDDFEGGESWKPLIEIADFIKIDLSSTTPEKRAELKRQARGSRAQLLIERVETQEDLTLAKAEGFTLFQGFYFRRPMLLKNQSIPANGLVHIEILNAVLESPLNVKRVGILVKQDPSLTYRLLRLVNSALFASPKAVTSIEQALVRIGDEMFRRMVMVATVGTLGAKKPHELLRAAFLRGRFCELAAQATGKDPTEQYLLGMLSLMPAMLNAPIESIAGALPLRDEMRQALLGESNPSSWLLDWLRCHELGRWEECDELRKRLGLEEPLLMRLYSEAVLWAQSTALGATK